MSAYPVNETIQAFLLGQLRERPELMRELRKEFAAGSLEILKLTKEIADEAIKQKANPAQTIQLGLWYGMAIGILMEKISQRRVN